VTALGDRRYYAREAGLSATDDGGVPLAEESDRMDVAVEQATRVRITDEIVFARPLAPFIEDGAKRRAAVEAAFEAAGFEIEH
jgi:hypothetical protein